MKKRKLLTLFGSICLVLVLAALLFPACAKPPAPAPTPPAPAPTPPAPVITWKFSYHGPNKGGTAGNVQYWVDEVERRSEGRLKLEVYWGGQLATSREALEVVQSGLVDFTFVIAIYYPGEMPLATIPSLPFIQPPRSDQAVLTFAEALKSPAAVAEARKNNIVPLVSYCGGAYAMCATKPVQSADDIKGLKVRTAQYSGQLLNKFGAVPVAIPLTEAYQALNTGLCDATTGKYPSGFYSYKWFEVAKYIMPDLRVGHGAALWSANLDSWNALPDDLKAVFEGAALALYAQYHWYEHDQPKNKELKEEMFAAGCQEVEFPSEELAKLEARAPEVWDTWLEKAGEGGQEMLDAWLAAKKKVLAQYPEGLPPYQP